MKFLYLCLGWILSFSVYAYERGINYDPAHSRAFVKAQTSNNLGGMKAEVQKDLEVIAKNGFKIVKTFYSSLSTIDGKNKFTIAEMACPMGLRVMLGVYEFDPGADHCSNWCETATATQVQDAINSVNRYPNCIIGIVVGNEDIYNWNFTQPNNTIQRRIAADIRKIKAAISGSNVPVGSAQQDGAWLKLAGSNDQYKLIEALDFVGANIYPFWSAQKPTEAQGHQEFMNRLQAIRAVPNFQGKSIIVTEEGWPSKGSHEQNPNANLASEQAYYSWWNTRQSTDDFDSYYFAIFDKQPTNSDADKYFGLCEEERRNKILNQCN